MTASVQPTASYFPGVISSNSEATAHMARGRALQGRALREGFGALLLSTLALLKCYGCLRERYARVSGRPRATS